MQHDLHPVALAMRDIHTGLRILGLYPELCAIPEEDFTFYGVVAFAGDRHRFQRIDVITKRSSRKDWEVSVTQLAIDLLGIQGFRRIAHFSEDDDSKIVVGGAIPDPSAHQRLDILQSFVPRLRAVRPYLDLSNCEVNNEALT